jgi:hypothetical protein
MCKEMPVIPVNKVVDQKNNRKKWRAKEEEERHKRSLTQKKECVVGNHQEQCNQIHTKYIFENV